MLQNLPRLSRLDVSWNNLSCFFSEISILRRHTPFLVYLDARHNPWIKVPPSPLPQLFSSSSPSPHIAGAVQETHPQSIEDSPLP